MPRLIARRKHYHVRHGTLTTLVFLHADREVSWSIGTTTTLVFLHADREVSWSILPSSVSLLSGSTVQPENTYCCILKVRGQV